MLNGNPKIKKVLGCLSYGIAAGSLQLSKFICAIIAASVLGPKAFAPWILLSSIMNYSSFVQLGLTSGLYRELPVSRGGGDEKDAASLVGTSNLFLGYASLFIIITSFLVFPFYSAGLDFPTYMCFVALLFSNQIYNYQYVLSHSFFQFRQLTYQMGIFALSLTLFVSISVHCFHLKGFIALQAVLMSLSYMYLNKLTPYRQKSRLNYGDLKRLLKTGLPISLIGIIYSLFITFDRWAIELFIGGKVLAYYALSVFCVNSLSIFTKVISPQFYSRMSFEYGRTGNIASLRTLVWRQFTLNVTIMVLVYVVYLLTIDYFVSIFLTEYIPGVHASKIIMIGVIFLACVNPFAAMFNSTGMHRVYLTTQICSIAVSIIIIAFTAISYRTIESVAIASSIGYLIYMISMVLVGSYVMYNVHLSLSSISSRVFDGIRKLDNPKQKYLENGIKWLRQTVGGGNPEG